MTPHYQPSDGYVGDPIPCYWNGTYHLFYLKRPRTLTGADETVWAHASTRDWQTWEEHPVALELGAPDAPDGKSCWTGSVTEANGLFHIFYTGYNPALPNPQTICHATSPDLLRWTKDPANPILLPDPAHYESDDWRDPFVFWNEGEGVWWMTITARVKGNFARRGCVALATSPDLVRWEIQPPIWSPHLINTPECTDLFSANGRYYLLFSTNTTRVRMAWDWRGPWERPALESLDGTQLYAAKAFHTGDRHVLVGWIPTRQDEKDEGQQHWGGCLSWPRELVAQADGSLAVRLLPESLPPLTGGLPTFKSLVGAWDQTTHGLRGSCPDGAAVCRLEQGVDNGIFSFLLTRETERTTAGVLLRWNEAQEGGYHLMIGPEGVSIRPFRVWGDAPPMVYSTWHPPAGVRIPVLVAMDGSVLEVFVGEQIALTCRIYNHSSGRLGLWVSDGAARFEKLVSANEKRKGV